MGFTEASALQRCKEDAKSVTNCQNAASVQGVHALSELKMGIVLQARGGGHRVQDGDSIVSCHVRGKLKKIGCTPI